MTSLLREEEVLVDKTGVLAEAVTNRLGSGVVGVLTCDFEGVLANLGRDL